MFKPLVYNTAEFFIMDEISADKAYSSVKNYNVVEDVGATPYIVFKSNVHRAKRYANAKAWNRAFYQFKMNYDDFMEHYHKRSNVETTFACMKQLIGETVRSKNRVAQENELLCKVIAYNIIVVVKMMAKYEIKPEFSMERGMAVA